MPFARDSAVLGDTLQVEENYFLESLFGKQPASIIASSSNAAVVEEVVESKTDVQMPLVLSEYQQTFTKVPG